MKVQRILIFMKTRSRASIPLTLQEFADAVGVSYQAAWQMMATGKLNPCVDYLQGKRKRVRRFDAKEVDRVRGLIRLRLPVTRDAVPDKLQVV